MDNTKLINQINQIKGTELIRVATKFGNDIVSLPNICTLMMVSNSCKTIANIYFRELTTFSIYPAGIGNINTTSQKNYTVKKLNHVYIKQLSIFADFSRGLPLIEFALKCSNVRTLCVNFIYLSIQPYIWHLQKLENVYLTSDISRTHFYLLLALPNISIIQWVINRSTFSKAITLVNYHKNTPLYRNIKLPHIILCCDHEYKNTVTQKCVEFTTDKSRCDIIHLDKINTYLTHW